MPADALPVPWPEPLAGTVTLRREYRDLLNRPTRGRVVITGTAPVGVVPAPVTVELANGLLEVDLPPDTYTLAADVRTVDGDRATVTDTITLTGGN